LKRTLIVLPPILIEQWAKEIFKISGHRAVIFHGAQKKLELQELLQARIVITTYNAVAVSKKKMVATKLHKIKWSRVIFDEAHHLRNKNTSIFLGCKNIHTDIRWLVTGTPIQNNRKDFYSLCNLLRLPASFYTEKENVVSIRENFILYRVKKEVGIILPELSQNYCLVPWSSLPEQHLSEEIHSTLGVSLVSFNKRGSLANYWLDGSKGQHLKIMMRAKQCCIMPTLLHKPISVLIKKGVLPKEYLNGINTGSKLSAVVSTIVSRNNNKGKIVFCQFHEEIDYLSRELTKKGLYVLSLDGRNSKSRQEKLTLKADVLILQIQTGCEGLNLQENYSEVYFVSPHWNPALEDQAIARCHRIGQKNVVDVFKFEMVGFTGEEDINPISLDKYIHNVQDKKREIAFEVLN
jgi:chromodomain-helicase-DNA-binding protein 1